MKGHASLVSIPWLFVFLELKCFKIGKFVLYPSPTSCCTIPVRLPLPYCMNSNQLLLLWFCNRKNTSVYLDAALVTSCLQLVYNCGRERSILKAAIIFYGVLETFCLLGYEEVWNKNNRHDLRKCLSKTMT